MNESTKSALLGVALAATVWAITGVWQFTAVAAFGALCAWAYSPPSRPQPRRRPRVVIREQALRELRRVAACYDYGGCQWRGDGVKGQPLVLGPGVRKGCVHNMPGHGQRRTDPWG